MSLAGWDTLLYILLFLVPGVVFATVSDILMPSRGRSIKLFVVKSVAFSSILIALLWSISGFYGIDEIVQGKGLIAVFVPVIKRWGFCAVIIWFSITFVVPALLGVAVAWVSQAGFLRRFLYSAGLSPVHPIASSWDYVFHSLREPVWLLVTLKDGRTVGGWYSNDSFASSDAEGCDLFIEDVYKIDDDNTWERVSSNAGILILKGQISHIELWRNRRTETAAQRGGSTDDSGRAA